ncbi:gliding motility protein GldL [Flavobacterium limnosediminis JC2902]|uniref:Gliding motility protein GldL n=1 Tax=Flavobacterium limnosediminis JC2902 TaxID=1341181 RepID=V6SJ99_9FLAO|nr:gliding motility protein GldL [Flavobacterium limnosediminis]ESU26539.1 gliding motility protein GldL [Flavobacterium limnosediminis JC2902]
MKNKQIVLAFILGCIITIIGALFKIMHWPGASIMLILGMLCEAFAGVMLIIKIYRNQNPNGFLNK